MAGNALENSFSADFEELQQTDYSHDYYVTRNTLSQSKQDKSITITSVGPALEQLYSTRFESSFFDIPSRAPRWATHSAHDYHGAWIPQITHWAIQKYTLKGERVLSNFLGRGTDAIECMLLERRIIGIDINPVLFYNQGSIKISRNNTSFPIPFPRNVSAVFRPMIMIGDARSLTGSMFSDNSFDHVLSHPLTKTAFNTGTFE